MKTYIFPVLLAILLSTVLLYNNNSHEQSKKLISQTSTAKKENNNQLNLTKSLITNNTIGNKVADNNKKETLAVNNTEVKTIKKARKPFIRKSFTYEAIKNNKGIIGNMSGAGKDNPVDNVFHFNITNRYSKRSVAHIEYELYGVKDQNSVTKGINNNFSYGGALIEKDTIWSTQNEEINLADLQMGHNVIRFSVSDEAPYGYRIKNIKLVVDNKNLSPSKQLIINQPNTATFHKQYGYLCGYVKGNGADKAKIYINGKETKNNNGSFEALTKSELVNPTELKVEVLVVFEDGSSLRDSISFNKVADYDFVRNGIISNQTQIAKLKRNENIDISFKGLSLKGEKNSINKNTTVTTSTLRSIDMPVMGSGLINVTGQSKGYRLLPHGSTFAKNLRIGIPYDSTALPTGYRPQDIRTYYFNENNNRWAELPYDTVDEQLCIVYSYTNHFTDFINGILKVPDAPQTSAYTPTSLKEMKAANPVAGINMMKPPSANNNGTASTGIAIEIPAGRNGMQPNLSINYSSEGGNGWMGVGWNLSIPSIDVETRWGVPRYSSSLETESYLMSGGQLTPMVQREGFKSRSGGQKRFYERIKGSYNKVMRYGTTPSTYFWVVTDRNGTKYYYGVYADPTKVDSLLAVDTVNTNLVLADKYGKIASWKLAEMRDLHGNFVKYSYQKVFNTGMSGGTTGRQIYPSEITYSGHGTTEGKYKVEFDIIINTNDYPRPDRIISARNGFKEVTANLLRNVKVTYDGQYIRQYKIIYKLGSFSKALICRVLEITDESKLPAILSISDQCGQNDMGNMSGVQVHEFEYYQENNLSYSTAETISIYDDEADYGLLGVFSSGTESSLNRTTMQGSSIGGSISIGPGSNITSKTYTVGGNYTYSDSKSESNVMIIDIDGDGLNDRVYKKDENYYYRKCIYNGDIIAYSSNERVLTGLPSIGKSFSYSHTWGAEIDLQPVRGDYNKRTTMSHNISYFSDVNADGYIDFIDEGSVYFNMPIEGIPKFGKNNNDTVYNPGSSCNYIVRSERIDSSIYIDNSEVDFCRDAVRMWVAPFAGDIEVLAPIQLIEDTSVIRDKSPSADGLIYSIQLSNSILIWDTIYEDEYNVQNLTPLQIYVDKGQHLYFRINSIKHRSFDIVKWSPRIRYYNRDTVITDANNLKINVFDVADDIIVGQNQIFIAPFQGTVRLKGVLNSTAQSDNIVFEIKKNMTVESSKSFSNATPISYSIDTTMVLNEGDSIALNIKTNTNIRLNDIGHTLKLEYLASDSITIDTNDQFGRLELRPELVFNYHQNTINASSKVSISSGLHTFIPVIGFSPTSLANGEMTFAIKQNQSLLAKKTFIISGGVIPSSAEISYSFTNATNIYCELYTEDVNLSNTISIGTISIDNGNSYCSTGIHAALADSLIKFGNLYRGWGQFGYKDDNCSGNTPINEKLLYIHKDTVMFDLDTTVITTYDQLKDSLDKYDVGDGKNMNFVPLFPLNDSTLWVDYTGMISVSGSNLSNRQSLAGSSLSSENGSIDNSSNIINQNIKNWTVRKTSKQITKTFSIGVSIKSFQVGLSWGNGDNTALVDYRDMNGDRYPDVVSQKIQYTNPLGGYMPTAVNPTLYNSQINYSLNMGYGPSVGLSSKETKSDGTDNTKGQSRVLGGDISLSYGNSSDYSGYTLFDINGDGLVDKINNDGYVQLNMGYKFEDIVLDNSIISFDKGGSNDYSLGGGFGTPSASTSSMSWSLGVALTYALNRRDAQYIDVNGDGLIDLLFYDNHNIYVKLNNGSSYNPAALLKSDEKIHRSAAYNGSADASLALGFSVSLFKVVAGLKGSISQSNQLDKQSLIDMNNDGYVDIVTISGSNEIKVQFSNLGKINMLKKVITPTNASFSMDYELTQSSTEMPSRKWVMNTVKTYDGYSDDGFDSLIYVYEYANPYYDRFERTFYGFNKVKTKQLSSILATYDYRTTTEEFINDDFHYKGKMILQALTDSLCDTLTKTVYTYTASDCSGPLSYDFPALLAVDNYFYEGSSTAQMHTRQEFVYDTLTANIISVDDKRNTAISTDDVQSYITY